MLPERLFVGVKDAQDNDGVIVGDGKMDGEGEGVDGLDAHVIVTDRGGGGKMSDIVKIAVEDVCKFETQAGRDLIRLLLLIRNPFQ